MTAADMLRIIEASRPKYNNKYAQDLDQALKRLIGRKAFSYSQNEDAQYKNYRAAALRDGRRAMEDSLGSNAALTGGFSNSFALNAAQQQYNNNLNKLQDIIPQLYGRALERYKAEGSGMQADVDNYRSIYKDELGAFEKQLGSWQKDRAYYLGKAKQEEQEELKRMELAAKTASRGGSRRKTQQKRSAAVTKDKLNGLFGRFMGAR